MTLRIPRTIFTLPVELVLRLAFDVRSVGAGVLAVSVNIVDVDDETRTGAFQRTR